MRIPLLAIPESMMPRIAEMLTEAGLPAEERPVSPADDPTHFLMSLTCSVGNESVSISVQRLPHVDSHGPVVVIYPKTSGSRKLTEQVAECLKRNGAWVPKPARNPRSFQYSLRTLLLTVTVAAVLLGGWKIYRKLATPPAVTFLEVWQGSLRNGDGLARVQELLGPGQEPEDTSWIVGQIRSRPTSYPAGVETGDSFVLYNVPHGRAQSMQVYLQFRNGILVNYKPNPDTRFVER